MLPRIQSFQRVSPFGRVLFTKESQKVTTLFSFVKTGRKHGGIPNFLKQNAVSKSRHKSSFVDIQTLKTWLRCAVLQVRVIFPRF